VPATASNDSGTVAGTGAGNESGRQTDGLARVRSEVIEMASAPNAENDGAVDLGPFAHHREAVWCERDSGHGLDPLLEAAS
jgi:hypothetical protein